MINLNKEIKLYPIQNCSLEKNRVSLPANIFDIKHQIGTRIACPVTEAGPASLRISFYPPFGDPYAVTVQCPEDNKFCAYYNI